MSIKKDALHMFAKWYENLPVYASSGGPARGTIGAALVVLERLKEDFDLRLDSHRAEGKSQIKGVSGKAVQRICIRFDEHRPFLSEGGRTNRGVPGDIEKMLESLGSINWQNVSADERKEILDSFQEFLVGKIQDFHNRQRLKMVYDPSKTTWQTIHELLAFAKENGKEGPVAQYLVGAKLQLRFPGVEIGNESYSTADVQLGRPGDFYIGDTAFHVTVAPQPAVYEKCKRNVEQGYRAYLLVPDRSLVGARQNAEATLQGKIAVESIESFVSQNVEELSIFSKDGVVDGFRRLLETYNERVDRTETDKSMLIEIPNNLQTR